MNNTKQTIFIDGQDQFVFQWDRGQRLQLQDTAPGSRVDFARYGQAMAASVYTYGEDGGVYCDIPDALLTEAVVWRVFVFESDGDSGETARCFLLPVIARQKPEDYVAPEDEPIWLQLKQQIDAAENQIEELRNRTGGSMVEVENRAEYLITGFTRVAGTFSTAASGRRTDYVSMDGVTKIRGSAGFYASCATVAFFDGNRKYLADISKTGSAFISAANAGYGEGRFEVDVTGSEYGQAAYFVVSTYRNPEASSFVYTQTFEEDFCVYVREIQEDSEYAPALDVGAYGLPELDLTGDAGGMTKENAVVMDYVYGDRIGTCTVKWQGSSSIAYPRKNYTVVFDVPFEAVEGWGIQSGYCLKADYIDFTHARNVVSARLWGQIVKSRTGSAITRLAELPNGGAIDGFPCVLRINGKYMGVYNFNIPKGAWMLGMGSGQNELIVCADVAGKATAFQSIVLSGGTDFSVEHLSGGHDAEWVRNRINYAINATNVGNSSNVDTLVARYVDIPSAIDYFIFTVLLRGGDMTQKNYILATYDGEKMFFSAYDMDSTYGNNKDGTVMLTSGIDESSTAGSFAKFAGTHKLMGLLYELKADEIRARYRELRETVMSEENVERMFMNYAAMIPKALLDEEARIWPGMPATNSKNVAQILNWYRNRCRVIDAEMGVAVGGTVPADCLPKAVRPTGNVTLAALMDALTAAGYLSE